MVWSGRPATLTRMCRPGDEATERPPMAYWAANGGTTVSPECGERMVRVGSLAGGSGTTGGEVDLDVEGRLPAVVEDGSELGGRLVPVVNVVSVAADAGGCDAAPDAAFLPLAQPTAAMTSTPATHAS
jgi:hypothetical protein